MKRAGTIAVAGAVGVFAGAAAGDDVRWKAPDARPAARRAAAPAPAPAPQWRPQPGDDAAWVAARGAALPPPAGRAPLPAYLPPTPLPLPLPESVAVQVPPTPAPVPPPVPPVVIPKVGVPPMPEPAPAPRPADPDRPAPLPPPRIDPYQPAPARPAPPAAGPAAAAPAAVVVPASASVWGSYAPCDAPGKPAACAVPVRHGTYGSPDLRLSRDYHFLDALVKPLAGDHDEKMILRDPGPGLAAADRLSVQAEYLMWWADRPNVPVLATTADNRLFGFLGQPGTTLLLGPGGFGGSRRDGFRVRAGGWFPNHDGLGADGSFFFLGRRSDTRSFGTAQFPTILRPIFAPNFGGEFGELVSFPGLSTGTLTVNQTSELWGTDVNVRKGLCCECDRRAYAFAGYRHLNLREELTITESLTAGPDAPDPAGTRITVTDRFRTANRFHGGQVGLAGTRRWGRVSLDGRASVALGVTHQVLDIAGTQTRQRPGAAAESFTGGLLAAGPNLGRFTRDRFSVVPEATLNLGYFLTPNLQVYAGYNFLYWSNVIRPGDQIDRVVDLTFVPNAPRVPFSGQNRPQPTFRQTDFWAQGVQFGVEFRW